MLSYTVFNGTIAESKHIINLCCHLEALHECNISVKLTWTIESDEIFYRLRDFLLKIEKKLNRKRKCQVMTALRLHGCLTVIRILYMLVNLHLSYVLSC